MLSKEKQSNATQKGAKKVAQNFFKAIKSSNCFAWY